jgi:hypothetical protein
LGPVSALRGLVQKDNAGSRSELSVHAAGGDESGDEHGIVHFALPFRAGPIEKTAVKGMVVLTVSHTTNYGYSTKSQACLWDSARRQRWAQWPHLGGSRGFRPYLAWGWSRACARLYCDAGLDTFAGFAQWEPEILRQMLVDLVERTGFDGIAPLPKEIRNAIEVARSLPAVVE